jgi:hypothetical protein
MKGKFGQLAPLTVAGLLAAVLGWRTDEATDVAPDSVVSPVAEAVSDAAIVRDLVVGRHSLLEAAALFRALDRLPPAAPDIAPEMLDQLLDLPPAASRSADERRCWQVIKWVRSDQTDGLPGREAAAARLEADLWERLRSPGGLRLPDADSLPPVEELFAQARDAYRATQRNANRGHSGGSRDDR